MENVNDGIKEALMTWEMFDIVKQEKQITKNYVY